MKLSFVLLFLTLVPFGLTAQDSNNPPEDQIRFFPEAYRLNDEEWSILKAVAQHPNQKRTVLKIGGRLTKFSRERSDVSFLSNIKTSYDWMDRSLTEQWLQYFPEYTGRSIELAENYFIWPRDQSIAETALVHWSDPNAYALENVFGNAAVTNNTISVTVAPWSISSDFAQIQTTDAWSDGDPYLVTLPDGMVWQPHWNLIDKLNQYHFRGLGVLELLEDGRFESPWFGKFKIQQNGWIIHESIGLIYVKENEFGSSKGYWFFHEDLGWLWTLPSLYPVMWSENLREQVLVLNLFDFLTAISITAENDLDLGFVEREPSDTFAYKVPEFEVTTQPGRVDLSELDWDLLSSLIKSSKKDRSTLYLSGLLSHYTQLKTMTMKLTGIISHEDPMGKSFSVQMEQFIPAYTAAAVQMLDSVTWDTSLFFHASDWMVYEGVERVIRGMESLDGEQDYGDYQLVGCSAQESDRGYTPICAVYGKEEPQGDPYFVFLPDGMFWPSLANLIYQDNLPNHGGLGYLEAESDGVYLSPWFGSFSVVKDAWIKHEIFGRTYVYGNSKGSEKGYRFYHSQLGWFWMAPRCQNWVYLESKEGWFQIKQGPLRYFLLNPSNGETIPLNSDLETNPS